MASAQPIWGLGRRKTSVARVRLLPGSGKIFINKRPHTEYLTVERRVRDLLNPVKLANVEDRYDIHINVKGGGETGQVGASVLGISRALIKADPELEKVLRVHGFLTRDSRMVERKKPGLHGARRGCQFSKR